jgi:hypothetical protein
MVSHPALAGSPATATTVHLYLTLKGSSRPHDLGNRDFGFLPQGGEEPVLEWRGRRLRALIHQIHVDFDRDPVAPIPLVHAREI